MKDTLLILTAVICGFGVDLCRGVFELVCHPKVDGPIYSGQYYTIPGECLQVTWIRDGRLSEDTCGISLPKNTACKLQGPHFEKLYPECCARNICPE